MIVQKRFEISLWNFQHIFIITAVDKMMEFFSIFAWKIDIGIWIFLFLASGPVRQALAVTFFFSCKPYPKKSKSSVCVGVWLDGRIVLDNSSFVAFSLNKVIVLWCFILSNGGIFTPANLHIHCTGWQIKILVLW